MDTQDKLPKKKRRSRRVPSMVVFTPEMDAWIRERAERNERGKSDEIAFLLKAAYLEDTQNQSPSP